jgi:cysteine synthase
MVSLYIKCSRGKQSVSVASSRSGAEAGSAQNTQDLKPVDRVETVSNDDAIEAARRLAREDHLRHS